MMKFYYNILKKRRFIQNKAKILSICSSFIDLFENEIQKTHGYSSCKEILMKELDIYLNSESDLISTLDDHTDNFTEISVAFISTRSLEFFEYCYFRMGGKYYNQKYCSPMMSRIHFKAIQWGFDHGFVTEEEMKEDKLAFNDAVMQLT